MVDLGDPHRRERGAGSPAAPGPVRQHRRHRNGGSQHGRADARREIRGTAGPEDQVAARELNGVLERAVDGLPDIYRTVFVLREVEELSTAETADCLGISEELVKVRLHRARGELRRRLESHIGSAMRGVYGFHLSRCDRIVANVMARINGPTTE